MVRGYLECVSKVIYCSTYVGIVFRSLIRNLKFLSKHLKIHCYHNLNNVAPTNISL
jgi:hypothetical protein